MVLEDRTLGWKGEVTEGFHWFYLKCLGYSRGSLLPSRLQGQGPPLPRWQWSLDGSTAAAAKPRVETGVGDSLHEAKPRIESSERHRLQSLMAGGCSVAPPQHRGDRIPSRVQMLLCASGVSVPAGRGGAAPGPTLPAAHRQLPVTIAFLYPAAVSHGSAAGQASLRALCAAATRLPLAKTAQVLLLPSREDVPRETGGDSVPVHTTFFSSPGQLGDRNCSLGFGFDLASYATSDSSMYFLIYDPIFWLSQSGS